MVNADPEQGCAMAVAEAARNIVCSGGVPSAITNCLNFGNPYNPEVYWQFVGAIKGMSKACIKFKTPVTGGNVSFYNQSSVSGVEVPVFPTPTIGMLGIVEDKKNITSLAFENSSDLIYLIGESKNDISSSEYLFSYHKIKESSVPEFDLDREFELQEDLYSLIKRDLIISAHDLSDGGLFISLLESAMVNKKGFKIKCSNSLRKDAFLFGESPTRVIVSVKPSLKNEFETYMNLQTTNYLLLGEVTDNNILIDDINFGLTSDFSEIYNNSLSKKLN
jgi:phosphoribosylformylglycinamidine (FGAM) synthase-like enzyme